MRGFTTVELLVSIAIMGLLAAVVIFNFRAGEIDRVLDAQAISFVSLTKLAQNDALTGQKLNGALPAAYGINLTTDNQAVLYADLNKNAIMDAGEELQRLTLDSRLQFDASSTNFLFKTFQTIDGFCWTNFSSCYFDTDQVLAVIKSRDDVTKKRTITIRPETGKINIE